MNHYPDATDFDNLIIVGDPVTRRMLTSSDIPVRKVVGEVQIGRLSRHKAPRLKNVALRLNLLLIHWHFEPGILMGTLYYCVMGRSGDVTQFWKELGKMDPTWEGREG